MELKLIEIEEFKKDVYKHYKKIFPASERKPYKTLKIGYYNKNANFYKIIEKNNLVGFIITQNVKDNPYILLDYFAILPKYQCNGYGKQAIKELNKIINKEYYGIFIEVEKVGLGKNKKENELRRRRIEFYEKLGFVNLEIDIKLFNIVFTVYILPCVEGLQKDDELINNLLIIYNGILGEERSNKYCKILKNM